MVEPSYTVPAKQLAKLRLYGAGGKLHILDSGGYLVFDTPDCSEACLFAETPSDIQEAYRMWGEW